MTEGAIFLNERDNRLAELSINRFFRLFRRRILARGATVRYQAEQTYRNAFPETGPIYTFES